MSEVVCKLQRAICHFGFCQLDWNLDCTDSEHREIPWRQACSSWNTTYVAREEPESDTVRRAHLWHNFHAKKSSLDTVKCGNSSLVGKDIEVDAVSLQFAPYHLTTVVAPLWCDLGCCSWTVVVIKKWCNTLPFNCINSSLYNRTWFLDLAHSRAFDYLHTRAGSDTLRKSSYNVTVNMWLVGQPFPVKRGRWRSGSALACQRSNGAVTSSC